VSVAGTYAEALYEAAQERGQVAEVAAQLAEVRRAIAENRDLRELLDSPEVETRVKKNVLASLLSDANPLVANFAQVLLDRGRATEVEEIGAAFDERVAEAEGRLRVTVRTAVPLPDDLRTAVVERIARQTGRPVDVETVVDPAIIGGVVIETDGSVVDASVRHRLDDMRRAMTTAPVPAAATAE
jgi:F-type H+-transporting ATPase subunit delta